MSLRETVLKRGIPAHPQSGAKKIGRGISFDPISWNEFFDEERTVSIGNDTYNVYLKDFGPYFYFLHGGGYSGLTWACLVDSLISKVKCRVVCPDLRGHGKTKCEDEYALSKEQQIQDIAGIFAQIYEDDNSPVCVVGHSMGGALAVHTVSSNLLPNVQALVVIDVVEGSAMDALSGMRVFLRGRPESFSSESEAIKWCLQSGTARTSKSARVSMPSQIKATDDGKYTWRIDLSRTADQWQGWFQGLSSSFLACSPPKLLVLAGVDRLDRDLTIGQMQGKFQTTVLPRVGHAVQEDSPDKLAEELARFVVRYKIAEPLEGFGTAMLPLLRI